MVVMMDWKEINTGKTFFYLSGKMLEPTNYDTDYTDPIYTKYVLC